MEYLCQIQLSIIELESSDTVCEAVQKLNFNFDQATSNPHSIINIIHTGGKTCVWLQMKFYFYFIKSK